MATKSMINKQIRSFAFVWMIITLIIGMAVFFAIYLTYDTASNVLSVGSQNVSLPVNQQPPNNSNNAAAAISTATPAPAVAQGQPEDAQATPVGVTPLAAMGDTSTSEEPMDSMEPLPIDTKDQFIPAIQVQHSLDTNPDTQRIWMDYVNRLGLTWFKEQVRWDHIEKAPGEYDWTVLDLVLPIAEELDYRVLASIVAAPEWAREPGVDLSDDGPPANNEDFVRFLTEMLNRYPGQIHAIEIWNEPNIDREWRSSGGVSAVNFVELQRVAYTTIKNIDPGIIVISGAPSPTGGFVDQNGVVRAIDDFDYMDQMISAGLLNYADCIGVHHNGYNVAPSYRWNEIPNDPNATFRGPFDNPHHSWSFRSTLETYANKIAVAGGDQKLCITEFGWPVTEDLSGTPTNFGFADDNTLLEQAEWTIEALDLMEEWGFVWIASIWNLNYGAQAGWDPTSDNTPYSIIGPDFANRPVFDAIAQWSAERASAS
jgi:hypothetical protein